jgi:hypothetical protein
VAFISLPAEPIFAAAVDEWRGSLSRKEDKGDDNATSRNGSEIDSELVRVTIKQWQISRKTAYLDISTEATDNSLLGIFVLPLANKLLNNCSMPPLHDVEKSCPSLRGEGAVDNRHALGCAIAIAALHLANLAMRQRAYGEEKWKASGVLRLSQSMSEEILPKIEVRS